MFNESLMINEERMSEILNELDKVKCFTPGRKLEILSEYLYSKITNTNKCYRVDFLKFIAHDIISEEEFPSFKQALVSRLKEAKLKVEEENENLIKVECSNKMKAEELPTLSPLQSKIIAFYKLHENVDEIVKQLVEKQKLTQQEYDELQIVRYYEF